MRQLIIFIVIAVIAVGATIILSGRDTILSSNTNQSTSTIDTILKSSTTRVFTPKAVDDKTIETIIKTGIQSPSARNLQPWHFSVVTNKDLIERINTDTLAAGEKEATKNPGKPSPPKDFHALFHAPLVIIISADIDSPSSLFDAALACENMSLAAQSLGLGTHISMSATMALTGEKQEEYQKLLGIPNGKRAVAVLLVGEPANKDADAISKATTRNAEVVTYNK
ncbi:MAG: nitroreductase [Firmicutes bacterium]|nr:nitroreductase [Bacillota bacterium]